MKSPAPALTRGLALLAWLNREGSAPLERIAAALGWPKASVLRLLRSLAAAGAAGRDTDGRRWRALAVIAPITARDLRLRAEPAAARLAATAGHTAEVWAWQDGRLLLTQRCEPEGSELAVRARIGFVRHLDELEACVQCALAWGGLRRPAPATAFREGRPVRVPAAQAKSLLAQVQTRGAAADLGCNANGVRRFAAPIRAADGALVGVMALACAGPGEERFLGLVREAARNVPPA